MKTNQLNEISFSSETNSKPIDLTSGAYFLVVLFGIFPNSLKFPSLENLFWRKDDNKIRASGDVFKGITYIKGIPSETEIVKLGSGYYHAYVATRKGEIYSFGDNGNSPIFSFFYSYFLFFKHTHNLGLVRRNLLIHNKRTSSERFGKEA